MITTQEILKYLRDEIDHHIDPRTGEANLTAMAEDAINTLAGDDWERWHEEDHPVWDLVVDVAEYFGAL